MNSLLDLMVFLIGIICIDWFFISIEPLWIRFLVFIFGSVCIYGFIEIIKDGGKE